MSGKFAYKTKSRLSGYLFCFLVIILSMRLVYQYDIGSSCILAHSKSGFDKFLKSGYEIVAVIMRDGEEWI